MHGTLPSAMYAWILPMVFRSETNIVPYRDRVHLLSMLREMFKPRYIAMRSPRKRLEFQMDSELVGDDRFI